MLDHNFNYEHKTVSSTGNHMMIQFLTDSTNTNQGFKAYFNYISTDENCAKCLNMTSQVLTSPNYPIADCSWLISSSMGNTITIQFNTFEVVYIKLEI